MVDIALEDGHFKVQQEPTLCPRCHRSIVPERFQGLRLSDDYAQVVYRCPADECRKLFIASYVRPKDTGLAVLTNLEPYRPLPLDTHEKLVEISPRYHEIRGQAQAAESLKLHQVAGCGYRKALEFLVKDYAVHKHPKEQEEISRKPLAQCIAKYMPQDDELKDCAERAAWLGNDETHYTRIWEGHDIGDLKTLLDLTGNRILSNLQAEEYRRRMSRGNDSDKDESPK